MTGQSTRTSVRHQNRNISSYEEALSIGVLDIYGFEIFEVNGFEQFCINYVNEKLQQIFIELTIKSEQEDYQSEGIQWTPIPYFDNKIVCELIEGKRPPGVFAVLDDTVKTIKTGGNADGKFLDKLNGIASKNKHYSKFKGGFQILHYAGNVGYSVQGFVEANKDTLSQDMLHLSKSSQNEFIRDLYPEEVDLDQRRSPPTNGHKLKSQCGDLVYALMDCEPHYVRCIKSNDRKKAGLFNTQRVKHQSLYLGLLENVKVRRAGFAYRVDFFRFIGRFKVIGFNKLDPNLLAHGTDYDICKNLLMLSQQYVKELTNPGELQMGKTKVFIKTPETYTKLQEVRKNMVNHLVVKIQTVFRRFMNRKDLVFLRNEMQQLWEQNHKEATASDLLRPYLGTYIDNDDIKLQLSDILDFYQSSEINQERIEYSDIVFKLNASKKWEKVVIAVTDQALYLLIYKEEVIPKNVLANAKKTGQVLTPTYRLDLLRRTSLKQLQSINLSHMADDIMVIMCNPQQKIKPDKSKWVKASKVKRCMETQEKFSMFGKKRYQCGYTGNVYVKDVMTKLTLPDLGFYTPTDVHNSVVGFVSVEAREDIVLLTEKKAELTAVLRDLVTRIKGGGVKRDKPVLKTPVDTAPKARAMYDYVAQQPDEISFKESDTIELLDTSNPDWWMGILNGKQGLFPAAYVQKIHGIAAAPKRANPNKGYKLDINFSDVLGVRASTLGKGLSNTPNVTINVVKNQALKEVAYQSKGNKYIISVPPGVAGQRVLAIQQKQAERAAKREQERLRIFQLRQQNAAQREAERAAERERKLEAKKAKKKEEKAKRDAADKNKTFANLKSQGTGASFAHRINNLNKVDTSSSSANQSAAPPPWITKQLKATGVNTTSKTFAKSPSAISQKQRRDTNWRQNVRSMTFEKSKIAKPKAPPKKTQPVEIWESYEDDDTHDVYYYNPSSGETQWEKPKGMVKIVKGKGV